MAITKLNSLAIPPNTIVESDLSYPLTNFSSTGIDDNATSTAITIDASENVGIGTASPATPLHVNGTTAAQIRSQATTGYAGVHSLNNSGNFYQMIDNSTGAGFSSGAYARIMYSDGAYPMAFYTNANERMRIDSSGSVGIATTSPATKFEVAHATTGVANNISVYNSNTAASAECAVDWALERTGSAAKIRAARISAGKEQTWTTTGSTVDGYLKFLTVRDESLNEAMRINAAGGVYLGTTGTSIGSSNLVVNEGVYVGAANGDNQIRSSSSGGGSATLYIGNAAIQVSSDRRLKENIIDTSMSALDKLDQVRVVDFTWNDPSDTAVNNRNARGTWTGIIAQELVDVFPFAVNAPRNEDDLTIDEKSESTWQVDQDQLVPVLIKAIQELKAEVAALKGA